MAMNPLPPQAYTKDTLVKSYNWLALQGPHIKELATTTDVMVSLYLKAQRDGLSSLENPSIQNFKNELKTLTTMLGNFDVKESATTVKSPTQQSPQSQNQSSNQQNQAPTQQTQQTQNQHPQQQPQIEQTQSQTQTLDPSMIERQIHKV